MCLATGKTVAEHEEESKGEKAVSEGTDQHITQSSCH